MGTSGAFFSGIFLLAIVQLPLAGCAITPSGPAIEQPPDLPTNARVTAVPFYAQEKYQCGPAALAMALQWSGRAVEPEQLVPAVYTPARKGSLQWGLVTAARRHGRLAYPINGFNALMYEVAAGRPVIVLQNLGLQWIPRWHYAVVIGYDLDRRRVVMHSGASPFRSVGFKTFAHTWKRADYWGLVILPPDQMPRNPEMASYLKSALGLQLAGHVRGAIEAFEHAMARWPRNVETAIALGNAYYLDGSKQKAIGAFSKAVRIDPRHGAALNNLAHLLAESGDLEKAEIMALRAVEAGGAHAQVYRQTLEEIRAKRR
jgi:tetratricopeptide (TPR) repeat protein